MGNRKVPDQPDISVTVTELASEGGLLGLILSLVVVLMLYRAWAVMVAWRWLITPVFDLPAPSLTVICGLLLLLELVRGVRADDLQEDTNMGTLKRLLHGIIHTSVGVIVIAVLTCFL